MHLLQEQTQERCTPDDHMLMSRVMSSAQRMHGLISDLLALARVSQTQLQRTRINLSEIAEEVMRQERQRDPEHRAQVEIAPDLFADCDATTGENRSGKPAGQCVEILAQGSPAAHRVGSCP